MAQPKDDYETAEYKVLISDGRFEVRDYPDLMLAATTSNQGGAGADGSFMKLFRYISGANESKQKISMTTPVFMERQAAGSQAAGSQAAGSIVQMGFVIPKEVAALGAPNPEAPQVELRLRPGGRFAVVRFSGLMNSPAVDEHAAQLRSWMESKCLVADAAFGSEMETAGYDSPFTPPARRRNEVLVRLKAAK